MSGARLAQLPWTVSVTLQFDYFISSLFAGYAVARRNGLYAERRLAIEVAPTVPSGHESRTYNSSFDTTSFIIGNHSNGHNHVNVEYYNGFIYILDGSRILKSTTPLEL